jgi:hypothetical protein
MAVLKCKKSMLILNEENKKLKGMTFKLPDGFYQLFFNIIKNNPNCISDPGYKRSKNVIEKWPYVTMEWLKNMKHFFSITSPNSDSYKLAGGDDIKFWVDEKLDGLTSKFARSEHTNNASKPRTDSSALNGSHGDHQSSSLSMVGSLISGLVPKLESKQFKTVIITEDQLKNIITKIK